MLSDANSDSVELHRVGHGAGAARGVLPRGHRHQPAPLALAPRVPLRRRRPRPRQQGPPRGALLLHAPADDRQVSLSVHINLI